MIWSTRIFRRCLAAAFCILFMLLTVTLLMRMEAYFKTASDEEPELRLSKESLSNHFPHIKWLQDDAQIEGDINPYLRKQIEQAYIDSWHIANISLKSQNDIGLRDYFSDRLASRLSEANESADLTFQRVDLVHHLKLHLLSLDKRVVAFSDSSARVVQTCHNKMGELVLHQEYSPSFDVIMALDDGRWRIVEMEQTKVSINEKEKKLSSGTVPAFKGINYYPAEIPWKRFWEDFDRKFIARDFPIIDSLGYDLVRIFIPFESFGGANVAQRELANLNSLLDMAHGNNLSVIITLFDFPIGFGLETYTAYDRHLISVVQEVKNHPALLLWDLKNEPDIDFKFHDREEVRRWLEFFLARLRQLDSQTPITIGWADIAYAGILAEQLDLISFHYYDEVSEIGPKIDVLREQVGDKPISLEEYGRSSFSSWWYPFGYSEAEQQQYIELMDSVLLHKGIRRSVLWCYSDYEAVPSYVAGSRPWIKATQRHFGLVDPDGRLKRPNGDVREIERQETPFKGIFN